MEYRLQKFTSGMHYIMVNSSLVNTFKSKGETRALCKLNNQLEFHCAFMPKKEGGYYVNIGTRICKKLNLKEGDMLRAIFTVDASPHQFEMPEELREVLAEDSDAHQVFRSLTQGKQRGLMYLVTQVKSSDKRIERALKIAAGLKNGCTSPRTILK